METLVGRSLPSVLLQSTDATQLDVSQLQGRTVLFCYPYTGRPGVADPEGWDEIPGAHGSTPQALAYSKLYRDFLNLGVSVFGISFQASAWQLEFVQRNALQVPLLSDEQGAFAIALGLPQFKAGSRSFMRRVTLLCEGGCITKVRQVAKPELDAEETLAMVRAA